LRDFSVRPPTLDDATAVAELLAARDQFDFGELGLTSLRGPELREWWSLAERPIEEGAWLAERGGDVVAYVRASPERDLADVDDESAVHPDARGRGIGSHLLDLAESWARDEGFARMHVHVVNDDGRRLVEGRGHELVRYFWRMEIDLDAEPPEPVPPEGFELRGYRPGEDDERIHRLHQAAFAEHWEFTPEPFETWLRWRTSRGDYNPELWRLAVTGDELAGVILGFGEEHFGWILDLAVAPTFRRHGLGSALLGSGFRAMWMHGHSRVGLEVDSENETGATRLYERAGMRLTRRYATYEKRLS
jgi:mycothiol synthase